MDILARINATSGGTRAKIGFPPLEFGAHTIEAIAAP